MNKDDKSKVSIVWVIALLILCLFLIIDNNSKSNQLADNSIEMDNYEETIKDLDNQIYEYEKELQSLNEDLSYYKDMVNNLENYIEDLTTY